MALLFKLSAIFLLLAVCCAAQDSNELQEVKIPPEPLTELCLSCICQASSGCRQGLKCESDHCGMLGITEGYWIDAGRPTVAGQLSDEDDAYQNCANDPYCAALAVQGYVNKLAQDCNGDGKIDCYDYMTMHKKGGWSCTTGKLPIQYSKVFKQCLAGEIVRVPVSPLGFGALKLDG